MEMTIQQLRLLSEVANRGTIAAAAGAVGFTPSAVSQQLAGLEKALGVSVLERVGRNVRLTDAGRELVRHAGELLVGMEAARVAVEQMTSDVRGQVTIGVFESVASALLAPLLEELAAIHPALNLQTHQYDPEDGVEAVALGEIDLAFGVDYPHAPTGPRRDIERVALLDDRHYVVVSGDDVLGRSGEAVHLEQLADRQLISSPPTWSCGRCVVAACRRAGFEPNLVHQLDDFPLTLRLVEAGHGTAIVPSLGLTSPPPNVRIVPIEPPLIRQIQLVYRKGSAGRPAIVAIREALAHIVGDLQRQLAA